MGEEVERPLIGDHPLPRKAWRRMREWYRAAVDHAPLLAQITLEHITVESVTGSTSSNDVLLRSVVVRIKVF